MKITNLLAGGNNGSYIFYKDSVDADYNSYLLLFNKASENTITIEWNSTTKKGRIKDFNINGDENWYCWDESQNDISCQ